MIRRGCDVETLAEREIRDLLPALAPFVESLTATLLVHGLIINADVARNWNDVRADPGRYRITEHGRWVLSQLVP